MGADGYLAHPSHDGTAFWKRIQERTTRPRRYSYWSVGENLLWARPTIGAAKALQLWIASPEHLRNLLDPPLDGSLGVSVGACRDARAAWAGGTVTITTDFGVRR